MEAAGTSPGLALRGMPVALVSAGPGLFDEHNPARELIFDAGKSCTAENPLIRFYAEDVQELDWLRDYVMDTRLVAVLNTEEGFRFRVDEELDDTYVKDALTNIDSSSDWADAS